MMEAKQNREAKLKSGMRRIAAEDMQNIPQNDNS